MFELNKVYTFETLAPSQLGGIFHGMKVKGILTAGEAIKHSDITTTHTKLRTVISGLPRDVNDCTFILFEQNNQERTKVVMANEWLDINNIQLTETTNIRLEIYDTSNDIISLVKTRLSELGIHNIDISTF